MQQQSKYTVVVIVVRETNTLSILWNFYPSQRPRLHAIFRSLVQSQCFFSLGRNAILCVGAGFCYGKEHLNWTLQQFWKCMIISLCFVVLTYWMNTTNVAITKNRDTATPERERMGRIHNSPAFPWLISRWAYIKFDFPSFGLILETDLSQVRSNTAPI